MTRLCRCAVVASLLVVLGLATLAEVRAPRSVMPRRPSPKQRTPQKHSIKTSMAKKGRQATAKQKGAKPGRKAHATTRKPALKSGRSDARAHKSRQHSPYGGYVRERGGYGRFVHGHQHSYSRRTKVSNRMMLPDGGSGGGDNGADEDDDMPVYNGGDADSSDESDEDEDSHDEVKPIETLGMPTSDGRLSWPLGIRSLPTEAAVLCRQIDALAQTAAKQAIDDELSPQIAERTIQATAELRKWLANRADRLPSHTSAEAFEFLSRLDRAMKSLEAE
jgi:hypothetical protein